MRKSAADVLRPPVFPRYRHVTSPSVMFRRERRYRDVRYGCRQQRLTAAGLNMLKARVFYRDTRVARGPEGYGEKGGELRVIDGEERDIMVAPERHRMRCAAFAPT